MISKETLADGISVTVKCDNGHRVTKPLPWLASHSSFGCTQCGTLINLKDAEVHELFKVMFESASRFGPFGTRIK